MASIGGMGEGEGEIVWGRDWGSQGGLEGCGDSFPPRQVLQSDGEGPLASLLSRREGGETHKEKLLS